METPSEVRQQAARAASAAAIAWRRSTEPLPMRQQNPTPAISELGFGDEDSDVGVEEATQPVAAMWGKRGRP
jgi:hypothetical protein